VGSFGLAVGFLLSCVLCLLISGYTNYQETKAELKNMRMLLFSDLSKPVSNLERSKGLFSELVIPGVAFMSGNKHLKFTPFSNNSLTISNDTHSISYGNNAKILEVDGRLLDNKVGLELLFSNGTDNIVVGNKTKSLTISNDIDRIDLPTINDKANYLQIQNSSHTLQINSRGFYYQSCPPRVSCLMSELIPILTGVANSIFGGSSSSKLLP
jgi:hypothetical protein